MICNKNQGFRLDKNIRSDQDMAISPSTPFIRPDWPAPSNVKALTTTRYLSGGYSENRYAALNPATHTGDNPSHVRANRRCLMDVAGLPSTPVWLNQVHGKDVIYLHNKDIEETRYAGDEPDEIAKLPVADASISDRKSTVCAVLTADCLPVFFCDKAGTEVAVAHAGWRGLHAGVLEQTVAAMKTPADEIMVWFGPAIGSAVFEVGAEVRQAFVEKQNDNRQAFVESRDEHYLCDIYSLGRHSLMEAGVKAFYGGGLCTFSESQYFYSFRRDGETGRMANLIWLAED